jgi:hypothetical protein
MFAILHSLGMFVADMFKSRSQPEAENLFLHHQLAIGLRRASTQRIILLTRRELRSRPVAYQIDYVHISGAQKLENGV